MSAKNSIQVGIKVRPLLAKEKDMADYWLVTGNTITSKVGSQAEPYRFDFVFDQDASNQIIFKKMAEHIVHSAVHGFNGTIFAYGQTASGKTYTMMGEENDPGVMVLAAKEIFNEIDKMTNCEFLLRGGFIEIYNEKIYDLLSKSPTELKIHEGSNGSAHVNCKEICITSEDQLLKLLEAGNESRTVGETNMNERSSRSHAIFRLIIESRQTDNVDDDKVTQSVLNLVDLAGSERADQTGARGARLKEGGHINKSLLFLSNVISRLSENEDNKYINYRDSKLTRILQASLGGNAFTSIICTVTPTSIDETHSTLSFAMRAKTVKNKPHVNEIISDSTMMKRLTREIQELKKELEEERSKNTSQLKLNQIEQMLGFKEHKFINSLSLKNSRHTNHNRRRTWCAESIDVADTTSTIYSANMFNNEISTSRLKPPKSNVLRTPLITMRDVVPEKKYETHSEMDIVEEEFEPATTFDFNKYPSSLKTPKKSTVNDDGYMKLSLSPDSKNTTQHVELLEKQLASLQEFANLEKEYEVEHDLYGNVKFKLDAMCKRKEMLENERVEYLTTKNELYLIKEQLNSSENRCDNLKSEIARCQLDKQAAEKKIEQLESELWQLKESIQTLENENRNVVSLQFELETLRKKSKLREVELLDVLEEKDRCIAGLEKQLKSLQANKLNQSKEELMQLVRSTASESTDGQVNKPAEEEHSICLKCEDLQRLLDDNKKVAFEFDKLTIQYRELQQSFEKVTAESQARLVELNQWHNESTKSNESEELRKEISTLRLRFEILEREYEDVKCHLDEKSERCESLCREVEITQEQLSKLQNKCIILEGSWQEQENVISVIKSDYDLLENKYNELRTTYENLEHSSTRCSADCVRLQSENDELQNEIQNLKSRVEEMQTKLLHGYENKNESNSIEKEFFDTKLQLQNENDRLNDQLKELQTQLENLQQENDQLSTTIMETLQENDTLMASCKTLNAERLSWEAERSDLQEKICELKKCSELKAFTGASDDQKLRKNDVIPQNPSLLLQYVDLIDLIYENGKNRTYTAIDSGFITETGATYKMSLEKWEGKNYDSENDHNNIRVPVELGSLKAIITSIEGSETDLLGHKICCEKNIQFQGTIRNLEDKVRTLQFKNEALFESSQRNVTDLREEIKHLTKELFEKSMVLEEFVKEKAEITLLNEELQMKIAMSQSDINITNCSAISPVNQTVSHGSINSMHEDSQRSYDDTLKTIRTELMDKEEECKQLKLEMLEKNELAESEFRAHLRQYNEEWEQSRRKYKKRIQMLEMLINEVKIKNGEQSGSTDDSEKHFNDDLGNVQCEYEENYSAFHGGEKSSTPNTPSTSMVSSERYLELQKSRLERSQLVQECNEQISNLSAAISDVKEVNAQLYETLAEREELLKIKEAEIQSLQAAIEMTESKSKNLRGNENDGSEERDVIIKTLNVTIEMARKEVQNLEKKIASLEREIEKRDIEIIDLQAVIQQTEYRSNEMKKMLENVDIQKEDCIAIQLKDKDNEILRLKSASEEAEWNLKEVYGQIKKERQFKNEIENNFKHLQFEYDAMLEERNSLLSKVNELITQNKAVSSKINEKEEELSQLLRRFEAISNEKQEILHELHKSNIERLQAESEVMELKRSQTEFSEMLKLNEDLEHELKRLKKQQEENQELIENMKKQIVDFSEADGERSRLQAKLIMLKSESAKLANEFQTEKMHLTKDLEDCKKTRKELKEKSETLTLKMESLAQELHESKLYSARMQKTLEEYKDIEKQFDAVNQEKVELEIEVTSLRESLNQLKGSQQLECKEIENLKEQLKELQNKHAETTQKEEEYRNQISKLKVELSEEQNKFQRKQTELQSQLNELQLKCTYLKETNVKLVAQNKEIEDRLATAKDLQDEKRTLEARLETCLAETEKNTALLQMKLKEQEKSCKDLRTALATKETAKQKLENIIANLQSENKNLLERLEVFNEIAKKRVDVCESANNSMESSVHSQNSPLARRSPCKTMSNVNSEDKLTSIQKERKNRRLSTHDENRRQSSKFTVYIDVSTMTETVKNDCKCEELNAKLQECETQLYIRDSQVKALNFELRNHPLKAEKQTLVKRIQEEQEKNRLEVKKYHTKIAEQSAKIQALMDQANIATALNVPVRAVTLDQSTCTSPCKSLSSAGTQTDMDIDQSLHKLQGKYNDLKNICRFRYNRIASLEKQIEEKENILRGQYTPAYQQQSQQALTGAEKSSQKVSSEKRK